MRLFLFEPRVVAGVCVSAVVVAGLGLARQTATGVHAGPGSSGHHLLVWAIDKKAGTVAGFARMTIRPGRAEELVPTEGYRVRVEAGPVETVTVTDFRTESPEDMIRLKIARGRSSSEGMKSVKVPFLGLDYGIDEPIGAVILGVPAAALDAPRYREVLVRDDLETAAGLEDLLFAAREAPESDGFVRIADVLDVYRMLGRSRRLDRWRDRLSNGTPAGRREAAAILMVLGDEAGTTSFCRACLEARGNEQVRLIDILCQMPPSDEALATIVKLIVAPETYLIRTPGAGVADTERRYLLVRALAEKYPKEKVRAYRDTLRAYAASLPEDSSNKKTLGALLESR